MRLFVVAYPLLLFMPCYWNCVMCVCQLSLLIWAIFIDRLPEAICCCLQTYPVKDVLLIIYCMCLPASFVTSVGSYGCIYDI